jgi:hypothetical protein
MGRPHAFMEVDLFYLRLTIAVFIGIKNKNEEKTPHYVPTKGALNLTARISNDPLSRENTSTDNMVSIPGGPLQYMGDAESCV